MRYFIELSYRGSDYCGWQIQPNVPSVQGKIEEALSLLLKRTTSIMGSGRTDTGVHCRQQFAHFETSEPLDTDHLTFRLNTFLPQDIAIHRIFEVSEDAHARFSATQRHYEYHLTLQKNPFLLGLSHRSKQPLDFEKMNQAAALLLEYEDFEAFSKVKTQVKHFRCQITEAIWKLEGDRWVFFVSANRFLRGMVRAIVGTLLEVGKGKRDKADFERIILSKDRRQAGAAAPPEGLFLVRVTYPDLEGLLTKSMGEV